MKYLKKTSGEGIYLSISCMFAVLILSGCFTVGPDYVLPQTNIPAEWHNELKRGEATELQNPQGLAKWWTTLNDPVLSGLIDRAVVNNPDIRQVRAQDSRAACAQEYQQCRSVSRPLMRQDPLPGGKAAKRRAAEKKLIFIRQVLMRAGNSICSEETAVLLRLQPQTFRQAGRICGMFWSPFLPKLH